MDKIKQQALSLKESLASNVIHNVTDQKQMQSLTEYAF